MKKRNEKCRCKKCVQFRKEHTFEYLDIFGFYLIIAEFLVPRLKAFKKYNFSYPMGLTKKKWNTILNKIILAFEIIIKDDVVYESKKVAKIEEGLKLFAEYYRDLWI